MSTHPTVIAVTEGVPTAGAIVWWRLSGEVDASRFAHAWEAAGLDATILPSVPGPATALRRAVNEQRKRGVIVHPLGRGQGFALVYVRNTQQPQELDFEVATKCTLDQVGRLAIESPYTSLTDEEQSQLSDTRSDVRAAFARHSETLGTTDFSGWLTKLLPGLDAVALRDSGGVYFVPHASMTHLTAIRDVVHATTGHRLHQVPALKSEDAVNAILDAIEVEADAEAASMSQDIDNATLGAKGFANRIERCNAVEEKVARYERLLDSNLGAVRQRLDALRAALTVAVVTAEQRDGANVAQVSLSDV